MGSLRKLGATRQGSGPTWVLRRSSRLSDQPLLEIESLDAGYLGTAVVRGLNLHVKPGEVVALLGSTGAGKPPTLSTIAGLIAPLGGTIRYSGQDVGGIPTHRLARDGLSLVPEGRSLFFGMSVRDHLKLAKKGDSLPKEELLSFLPELEKCLDRKAGVLSGGEQ